MIKNLIASVVSCRYLLIGSFRDTKRSMASGWSHVLLSQHTACAFNVPIIDVIIRVTILSSDTNSLWACRFRAFAQATSLQILLNQLIRTEFLFFFLLSASFHSPMSVTRKILGAASNLNQLELRFRLIEMNSISEISSRMLPPKVKCSEGRAKFP